MKHLTLRFALAAILFTSTLPAQVPQLINYQGRVAADAVNFEGAGLFKFALVNNDGSTTFWSNDGTSAAGSEPVDAVSLPVSKGLYSVLLGDVALANMTVIPAAVFTNPDVRLRVWFNDGVNGSQLLDPDQRLAPAAYLADGAVTAATIADEAIVAAKIAPGAIDGTRVAPGALDFSHLFVPNAPGAGQVLGFDGASLNWVAPGESDGIWTPDGATTFYNGNVGIGGPAGASKLRIAGTNALTVSGAGGASITWNDTTSGISASISGANGALYYRVPNAANTAVLTAGYADANGMTTRGRLLVEGSGPYITWQDNTTGRVASISSANGALYYRVPNAANTAVLTAGYVDSNGLVVNGRVSVTGDVTARDISVRMLTIRGGADLAEPFQMREDELDKGSVVVIDDEHPGRLKRSTGAYDTRVAGIISGANGINPGITLHQEGLVEGGQNVALSGRVYVQADATGAPIKPGDLLTTSDTPGHAMKVTEHTRAQGAVIGKAMSSLKEGTGMVLVLVTLQ